MASKDKNNQVEEKKEEYKKQNGMGFFKKVKYSIFNIEKYPEMATEGIGKALSYIAKLVVVLAVVLSVWTLYQTYQMINEGTNYLENEFPDFSYSDGTLTVDSEEAIIIENEQFGKIIVDTNTDSEETINQYLNQIDEYGIGALVLKNRVVLKNITMIGEVSYNYQESFNSINLTEFNKQDVVNYVQNGGINSLYFSVFISLFIYSFSMYFINTLWYAIIIGIVGYFTMWILKMKMRYVAVFNMAIYALTLSTILNILYLIINIIFNFTIEYFSIMYVTVATIYLLAAIFILKTDLIKKQAEVMKIIEAQQIVKKELEQEKENKKEQEEKEERQKKDKEDSKDKKEENKESKGNVKHDEPEGSNAWNGKGLEKGMRKKYG